VIGLKWRLEISFGLGHFVLNVVMLVGLSNLGIYFIRTLIGKYLSEKIGVKAFLFNSGNLLVTKRFPIIKRQYILWTEYRIATILEMKCLM
tara:strand:+ start:90 stop:362 length:273 start_codon:yes stop_codon:yes gene_type:complete